jgi:ATPase
VAEFYSRDMKAVVKTMESPRDLQVGDEITQYAPIERDMQKTADILLLVRPDYTIYDELRKTRDFRIFADMRLAGVGMVGVVHATRPIDAIQRILGRVELGVIPSVVDTTIFIEDGEVKAVYDVSLTVKVPTGMQEADLARPVIEIRDLESGELMHEIYTYGEQTIVMDVSKAAPSGRKPSAHRIAEREIEREFRRRIPGARVRVELESDERARVWIDEKYIPQVIGKKGKTIEEIENSIGISIGVEPLEEREIEETLEVPVELAGNYVVLNFGKDAVGVSFDILVDDEYLFTATVGKKGTIKLRRDIELADIIMEAVKNSIPVRARVRPEA